MSHFLLNKLYCNQYTFDSIIIIQNFDHEHEQQNANEDGQTTSAVLNMSMFESMKHFVRLCQLCGLVPISAGSGNKSWKLNRSLKYLLLIHMVLMVLILSANLLLTDSLNDFNDNPIRVMLFYIFTVLCYVHALALLIETYWNRKHHRRLLNILRFLDKSFVQCLSVQMNYHQLKRSEKWMIFFSLLQSIALFAYMLGSYYNQNLMKTFRSMLLYAPGYFLGKLSYFYLTFLIKLIGVSIDVLNQYIKQMTKPYGYYLRESYINSKIKQSNLNASMLHVINRMYGLIWESSILVNHLMFWSLPIGMFYEFYLLIYYSYYIIYYILILRDVAISTYFRVLVWFLSVMWNLLLISNTCNDTIRIVSF